MSLPVRISSILALVLAFSLGLTAALNYVKFEKALSGVMLSRQQVTVLGLVDNIQTGLNLGLTLAEIQSYRQLLERAVAEHPDLTRAEVLDANGRRIFVHFVGQPPETETAWPPHIGEKAGWNKISPQSIALAEPLVNSFGQRVGVMVAEFSRDAFDRALADTATFTTQVFLALLGLGVVLSVAAGTLLMRPFDRRLADLERQLDTAAPAATAAGLAHARDPILSAQEAIRAIRERAGQ